MRGFGLVIGASHLHRTKMRCNFKRSKLYLFIYFYCYYYCLGGCFHQFGVWVKRKKLTVMLLAIAFFFGCKLVPYLDTVRMVYMTTIHRTEVPCTSLLIH